jgi:hypothetical protein
MDTEVVFDDPGKSSSFCELIVRYMSKRTSS